MEWGENVQNVCGCGVFNPSHLFKITLRGGGNGTVIHEWYMATRVYTGWGGGGDAEKITPRSEGMS